MASRAIGHRARDRRVGIAVAAVAALGGSFLAGAALTGPDPTAPRTDTPRVLAAGVGATSATQGRLPSAEDCGSLRDWYVARGLERVGPWGWDYPIIALGAGELNGSAVRPMPSGAMDAATRSAAPPMSTSTASETGTNVQELGVDEPDVVKTDGSVLVRVRGDRLTTYDVTGETPREVGSLDLRSLPDGGVHGAELLLVGDRAVVVGSERPTRLGTPGAVVLVVDLTDPGSPTVVSDTRYSASLVTARQHGSAVRVVLAAGLPDLDFVQPRGLRGDDAALRLNRRIVRESALEDWLPSVRRDGGAGEQLLDCEDVRIPRDESGLGTLAVVGLDPDDPDTVAASAVATDSTLAYLSEDRLYLASDAWGWSGGWWPPMVVEPWVRGGGAGPADRPFVDAPEVWREPDGVTRLHAFSLDGLETTYLASGEVDGRVADRWAMDESGGVLRVAVGATAATGNFNSVVTLAPEGEELVEVGRVDRLGVGEEIKAVRWFDDLAIVVTFRQTDPLYAIDLGDPARPRLLGELKIPGFSEYLHPLGSRRVLGLGQDASLDGMTRGAQAGLFDLQDLTDPRRVDTVTYRKGSQALAGWDPRQFTWLPERRTALTVIASGWPGRTGWVSVLRAEGNQLRNRMVEVEHGSDVDQVRLVPLPSGRVVLVTGDEVSFFPLP